MSQRPWWKDAVIYHIYPRSFYDSNGDGLGDLPGITAKLDHIRDLGATAIWMGPVFTSPQVDNGYDISNYRDIDPLFGSLEQMDELISAAHKRGIKVLLDLVLNHSSDQHPWFRASLKDPEGPYGDFYIWRDPPADGDAPNNWQSFFSVPAWTYAPERKQYYLHLFAPEQPDLNWENPRVREELAEVANFWLRRGVDGFRMDVINVISKKPGLPSSKAGERSGLFIDGPKVLEYLQEFRSRLEGSEEIVLVGETPGISPDAARAYTDPKNHALDMVLIFDHVTLDHGPGGRWDPRPLVPGQLQEVLADWQSTLAEPAWPSIYIGNHDQPRVVSRYGNDTTYRERSATGLATLFYLQRGTPIVYQGDEIGMANYPIREEADVVDVESHNAFRYLTETEGISREEALERVAPSARDNARTPMQWSADAHAGFLSPGAATKPWYPPNPDFKSVNVETQKACGGRESGPPKSVLCYYRRLFELRGERSVLQRGSFAALPIPEGSGLVGYLRQEGDDQVIVLFNLGEEPSSWELPNGRYTMLLTNVEERIGQELSENVVELAPYQTVVLSKA